ncbi:hypothetical protein BKA69DRAFT_1035854 [Paraphysoderma sedebokerense]|nr:hypothetical protein BKA69DRAFT_1035854 [Paraphysoderma sedebokerense]
MCGLKAKLERETSSRRHPQSNTSSRKSKSKSTSFPPPFVIRHVDQDEIYSGKSLCKPVSSKHKLARNKPTSFSKNNTTIDPVISQKEQKLQSQLDELAKYIRQVKAECCLDPFRTRDQSNRSYSSPRKTLSPQRRNTTSKPRIKLSKRTSASKVSNKSTKTRDSNTRPSSGSVPITLHLSSPLSTLKSPLKPITNSATQFSTFQSSRKRTYNNDLSTTLEPSPNKRTKSETSKASVTKSKSLKDHHSTNRSPLKSKRPPSQSQPIARSYSPLRPPPITKPRKPIRLFDIESNERKSFRDELDKAYKSLWENL